MDHRVVQFFLVGGVYKHPKLEIGLESCPQGPQPTYPLAQVVAACRNEQTNKQKNLKRRGEAAHGDVRRLTTCHIEVGAANFSWEIIIIIIITVIYHIPYIYAESVMVYYPKYEWSVLH